MERFNYGVKRQANKEDGGAKDKLTVRISVKLVRNKIIVLLF